MGCLSNKWIVVSSQDSGAGRWEDGLLCGISERQYTYGQTNGWLPIGAFPCRKHTGEKHRANEARNREATYQLHITRYVGPDTDPPPHLIII